MEFIKKHGIKILIALLVIFGMNKCTVACNRANEIEEQKIEIIQKDSIINSKTDSLNILLVRWNDAQNNQSTYQGIALGTKQALIDSINILKAERNLINEKLRKAELENSNLKKENKQLKEQVK